MVLQGLCVINVPLQLMPGGKGKNGLYDMYSVLMGVMSKWLEGASSRKQIIEGGTIETYKPIEHGYLWDTCLTACIFMDTPSFMCPTAALP